MNKTKLTEWTKTTIINGKEVNDDELLEFLAWSFVHYHEPTDIDYFHKLKETDAYKKVTVWDLLNTAIDKAGGNIPEFNIKTDEEIPTYSIK